MSYPIRRNPFATVQNPDTLALLRVVRAEHRQKRKAPPKRGTAAALGAVLLAGRMAAPIFVMLRGQDNLEGARRKPARAQLRALKI